MQLHAYAAYVKLNGNIYIYIKVDLDLDYILD